MMTFRTDITISNAVTPIRQYGRTEATRAANALRAYALLVEATRHRSDRQEVCKAAADAIKAGLDEILAGMDREPTREAYEVEADELFAAIDRATAE